MALVKFGAFMTDLSGKVGGTVFSKNRGGNYAKNKVIPNNPATIAQSIARGRFGALSSAWRALTQSQRDAWRAATENYPRVNRVGDTIKLAGNALFISLNGALLAAGEQLRLLPNEPKGVTEFLPSNLILDLNGGVIEDFAVSANAIDEVRAASMVVQIFATPPVSSGVKNVNSMYKQITVTDSVILAQALNFTDVYFNTFGTPPEGSKIGLKLVPVNAETGEQGAGVEIIGIVNELTP